MRSSGNTSSCRTSGPHPPPYRGRVFSTSEHAYAAAKTDDHEVIGRIAATDDAAKARAIGRAAPLVAEWDRRKYAVMESIVEAKFRHNPRPRRQTRRHPGGITASRGQHLARPDMGGKLQLPPGTETRPATMHSASFSWRFVCGWLRAASRPGRRRGDVRVYPARASRRRTPGRDRRG